MPRDSGHPSGPPAAPAGHDPAFVPATEACDVSVILVNYNTAHLLARCIGHLRAAVGGLRVSLIVVDNASRDDSVARVRREFPDVTLVANQENVGFGRANNQVLPLCRGRHVLLLNADAYLRPDTLQRSVAYLDAHPDCGVLGVCSVDEEGRLLFAGRRLPTPWRNFQLQTGLFKRWPPPPPPFPRTEGNTAEVCDWVVGCYYLVRRHVIDQVGLFDPRYFLYFEEVDHCRSVARAGWTVECLLQAEVVHVGGGSAATEGPLSAGRQISHLQTESALLFARKHGGLAGVLWATGLSLLTDVILAAKWLLKGRGLAGVRQIFQQSLVLWRAFRGTRAGRQPTR